MRASEQLALNYDVAEKEICDFIKREVKARGVVLGLSGGVDSSTVAVLSVKALGKDRVLALIMPEASSTPASDVEDAIELARTLGIRYEKIDITEAVEGVLKASGRRGNKVAQGNVKARMRMTLLYYMANLEGRIVVGSGDRSELLIGYFTKYGDGGVDILPLGGLYKTQVRELAKHIGIPDKIVRKKSSPRLWPGHRAEEELGMSYEDMDMILHLHADLGHSTEKIAEELGQGRRENIEKIMRRIKENAHKLKLPPIAKISSRARLRR
ncbi:MAG: NAD+ synthase [Candidatus Verstraetearchaeota archaeon]|nr:NAD+ synthase [Candidatus Verstraetearchaeota archaeon]